jgi:hypothetical protein
MALCSDRFERRKERCTVSPELRLRTASWRVPQRLELAPPSSIRLATPRRLQREMLETGFCHHHIQVRAPVPRGFSVRSRLAAHELQAHMLAARLVSFPFTGHPFGRATEPHRVSRRESGLRRIDPALMTRCFLPRAACSIEPLTPLSIRRESPLLR